MDFGSLKGYHRENYQNDHCQLINIIESLIDSRECDDWLSVPMNICLVNHPISGVGIAVRLPRNQLSFHNLKI